MKRYLLPTLVLIISLSCGQVLTATPNALGTSTPVLPTGTPLPTEAPNATPNALGETTYIICNTDALNLRALPGEEFAKIGELERGAEVYVYLSGVSASDGGQWSFILVDGIGFWANAKYICSEAK